MQRYNFALLSASSFLADWGQGPPPELWEILAAGTVPVYWGAQGLDRWLPDPLAAINAADFASPTCKRSARIRTRAVSVFGKGSGRVGSSGPEGEGS